MWICFLNNASYDVREQGIKSNGVFVKQNILLTGPRDTYTTIVCV